MMQMAIRDRSRQFDRINIDPTGRTMVRRLRNIYEASPEEIKEAGMLWYPRVHDAARSAAREAGKSTRQASGVVAAVSPNMDWERNNIHAFNEIDRLTPQHWDMIHRSASHEKRLDEVKWMLKEVAPGLSRAGDRDLLKAHRIWHGGEDPDVVLFRKTAPKTNTFFHNIFEPHLDTGTTVDGRHGDLIVDAMRPWKYDRGIDSADSTRGLTRYERYDHATRQAARSLNLLPHELQAVDWVMGQRVERGFDPARRKGDVRTGQSYQHRVSEFLAGRS